MEIYKVKITPQRELFKNIESSFYIYSTNMTFEDGKKINCSVKGNIPQLKIGKEYSVTVTEDTKSKYKNSYDILDMEYSNVMTIEDEKEFLGSITTPTQLKNIYDYYNKGESVLELIQSNQFDYSKINGIGDVIYQKIKEKVEKNLNISEIILFCRKFSLNLNIIVKFCQNYPNSLVALEQIQKNPYILTEVNGVGFLKADKIALSLGIDKTSPFRIESCILHCIGEENTNGHSWVSEKALINKCIDLLEINRKHITSLFEEGKTIPFVVNIDGKITKESVYYTELNVYMKIKEMINTKNTPTFEKEKIEQFLNNYCEQNNVVLEKSQRQFFHTWNENNISLLVGGGGMGKTWLQNILLSMLVEFDESSIYNTTLLAPTGKASKVMSNYTNRSASTIHRKLGRDLEGFIEDKYIIIDETSMCDIPLMSALFNSITNKEAKVLLVGDDFQLASVGYGNFLYDMINSKVIPTTRLTKVFRQADGGILDIATNIREGVKFINSQADGRFVFGKDAVVWSVEQDYILDGLVKNYKNVIKKYKDEDILVLSPTNKGKLGTMALNKEIQNIVNPPSPSKREKTIKKFGEEVTYRDGDLIMNTVNKYDVFDLHGNASNIFNGDVGRIIRIDEDLKSFIVEIEGKRFLLGFGELAIFSHAWVLTIHKSQGSQYKVVMCIVDKSAKFQLNANLLYTGVSRAKEFLLLLSQASTINYSINKFANMERRSFLLDFLTNSKVVA